MHIDFVEIGNFRKLLAVRINFSNEKTVFVGANNSGKTSAMLALRYLLIEKERKYLSFNDFTLTHWPKIDAMEKAWADAKASGVEPPKPDWPSVSPFIDVWLNVTKPESHYVQKIIPTLDWAGGRIGVRLRLEPRDAALLQRDYLAARDEARAIESADKKVTEKNAGSGKEPLLIWPKNLTDFLQRRLARYFAVRSYILDPDKLVDPEVGVARPQLVPAEAEPIEGDPFKGLVRIDEISAQRGFGLGSDVADTDEGEFAAGASAMRRMSEQLRRYWNRHLDPFDNPEAQDVQALRAIEEAQKAFDDRLKSGLKPAFDEVEGIGYPGVTDPRLRLSTRLRPIDGLNHEAAVQGDLDALLDLPGEKKVKIYDAEKFAIRVAYQCPTKISFKGKIVEALANTLEDALVFQNLDFFSNEDGTGLFARFKASIVKSTTMDDLVSSVFDDLIRASALLKCWSRCCPLIRGGRVRLMEVCR